MTDSAEHDHFRNFWLAAAGAIIVVGALALSVTAGSPFDDRGGAATRVAASEPDAVAPVSAEQTAALPLESGDRRLIRSYRDAAGSACRDFAQPVTIDDQPATAIGTVCRAADGNWALVDDATPAPAAPASTPDAAPPSSHPAPPVRLGRQRRAATAREAFLLSSVAIRLAGVRGQSGALRVVREYNAEDGAPCRDYEQSARLGAMTLRSAGAVCRGSDGSWALVAAPPVRTAWDPIHDSVAQRP